MPRQLACESPDGRRFRALLAARKQGETNHDTPDLVFGSQPRQRRKVGRAVDPRQGGQSLSHDAEGIAHRKPDPPAA